MELYRRLLGYLLPYWRRFTAALVFMIVYAVTTAGTAVLVKPVLDDLFVDPKPAMLWLLPGAIVALFALKAFSQFMQIFQMKYIGQLIVRDIRNDMFEHFQRLSLSYYQHQSTGGLIARVINDVVYVQEAVTTALASSVRDSLTAVGLLGVIFYREWHLALIAVLVLPAAILLIVRFGRTSRRAGKKSQEKVGTLSKILHENITGVKVVKAFGMEEREIERFRGENDKLFRLFMKIKRVEALSPAVMEMIGAVGIAGVVLFGGHQVTSGRMTPGTFFSFITALILLYQPVKRLAAVNSRIQEALAASERIFALLHTPVEVIEEPGAPALPPVRTAIEYRGVSFRYDRDPILTGVDLSVRPGEMVAFVGSSGAGKSTLVNLLPRFFDPTEGAVLFDGEDIRRCSLASLRGMIGLVTQETILFNDTVRSNITCGFPGASSAAVEEAARAAYAHDFITAMPRGYDSVIGEKGLMISGGERQRICIARAILKNAPILILDEATSSLDSESEKIVQDALNNLMRDKTTFVIAHRLSTVINADRIVVLDGGRIVDTGTHAGLLGTSPLYRRFYRLQFRGEGEPSTAASREGP